MEGHADPRGTNREEGALQEASLGLRAAQEMGDDGKAHGEELRHEPALRAMSPDVQDQETRFEVTLRPSRFDEFIGQGSIKDNLRVFVQAAMKRQEPLDHVLFCGPPGLGKTTLSMILGEELGVHVTLASGPALDHKGQLAALLTKLERHDVLFIDEIHRLSPSVEESLYTAIEDFRIDVVHGDGAYASALQLNLQPFTLVGATTRTGLLTSPLLSRFGYIARLEYYEVEELALVVKRSGRLLGCALQDEAALEVARRARGTPRIANRLLRRVRDFAEVLGNGHIDLPTARGALDRLKVDAVGLDEMDRKLLRILITYYHGGPVGIETLAAAVAEPRDTLEDVYEPFLVQQGFLARTPRGRVATGKAYAHLGIAETDRAPQSHPY